MQEKLLKGGLLAVFAISVLGAVGILTGSIDLGAGRVYELTEYAAIAGFFAFAGGALLSSRKMDSYETWEYGAVGVALGVLVVTYLGEPAQAADLLDNHHPWSGLGASVVAFVGYYAAAMR